MKAVWFEKKGSARDVLVYGEMADPLPDIGQVRGASMCPESIRPTRKPAGALAAICRWNFPASYPARTELE